MKNTRPISKVASTRAVTLEEARADGLSQGALLDVASKHRGPIGDDLRRVAAFLAASNDNRAGRRAAA